jgi:outer membrane protein assembly factor BamB
MQIRGVAKGTTVTRRRLLATGMLSGTHDPMSLMMQMPFATLFFKAFSVVVLGILLGTRGALATDWPQFRGPHRNGNWDETGILESFPSEGLKIRWRRPVGGGWSSPVVVQGRVFVFDVELTKPSARERLHCFAEKTGEVLWVYAYEEKYGEWSYVPERGAGPTATPIVEGDRIYLVGANGHTHCLDVKSGTVIWEKNIGREYQVAEMSCRPSPLIEGSLLIVFTNGHTYWREPMATSNNDSAATPVFQGNRLLVSGLMLDVSADSPRFLWPEIRAPSKRVLSNTSTPVLQGEYLFSARGSGELVCLEAATGRQIWGTNSLTAQKNGASINITPQGGGFFLFTDEGNLIRAQLSPAGYREISRSHLIDPTWPFGQTKFV